MGKEARIGLLLGATACLLAVMVDWVVEELHEHEQHRSLSGPARNERPAASYLPRPGARNMGTGGRI
ncbi:MAG TPA: hypothetical protein VK817_00225 [Trebonia sp.]|jgi:hypothetical protein|nr:hypothetical protein [Trebonia sp.]